MARLPELVTVAERVRPEADLDRRPDRVPAPARGAGHAGRRGRDPDRVGRVPGLRLRERRRRADPRRARRSARSGDGEQVLTRVHSECLTGDVFGSLRCDCGLPARAGARDGRRGGPGRRAVHARPRGPRDRAHPQAPGLRAAGPGPRHRRGEPRARVPRRSARLRDRRADPGGPRRAVDAAADEQPGQAGRPRGIRPLDRRARAAADRADRRTTSTTSGRRARSWGTSSRCRGPTRDRAPRGARRATGAGSRSSPPGSTGRSTDKLVAGATAGLARHGVAEDDVDVVWVPGAFEIPLVAGRLATSGRYDAVICLGAVIRGETAHFDLVANEAARGVAEVARATGVPVHLRDLGDRGPRPGRGPRRRGPREQGLGGRRRRPSRWLTCWNGCPARSTRVDDGPYTPRARST